MAINYAVKHAPQIDERFSAASITEPAVNKDYDFIGAKTVVVHSVPTVPMNDYQRSGASRYGTPAELEDAVQELTLSQDKAFTFTVDKGNEADDPALNAGKALDRQITEVIAPMVDRYRLSVMAVRAGGAAYGATTKANAYETFLDLNGMLNDANAPAEGRLAYVSTAYYKLLRLDSSFVRSGDLAQSMLISGQLGEVDGVRILPGRGRLPDGVDLLITHPVATTAPHKISEYRIHEDAPGISGSLVEGRDYFDAFVLNNKRGAIAVHFAKLGVLTATNVAGSSGKTRITAVEGAPAQAELVYKIGSAVTAPALGDDLSDWSVLTLGAELSVSSGDKYVVAARSALGKAIAATSATTAAV